MIPWVREKFAERRRKATSENNTEKLNKSSNDGTTKLSPSPRSSGTSSTSAGATCTILGSMVSSLPDTIQSTSHRLFSQTRTATSKSSSTDSPTKSNSNILNVRIVSPIGTVANITFPNTTLGFDVKLEALKLFSKDLMKLPGIQMETTCEKSMTNFRLIKSRIEFDFDEEMTLADANTVENDEFVLVYSKYRRQNAYRSGGNESQTNLKGPTQAEINRITHRLPLQKNKKLPAIVNINELVLQSDVQYDIRQIIVSLAQAQAHVIGVGPYARKLIEMFMKRLVRKRRHELDTMRNLLEMGFDRNMIIHALRLNNDNYASALNWLIDNQNSGINMSLSDSITSPTSSSGLDRKSNGPTNASIPDNVEILLEIIRIYCRRYIPPSSTDMIQHCIEMGFMESDARVALRQTRNNYTAACEWLVTNCNKSNDNGSSNKTLVPMIKYADGLPIDSPILKALMVSPHVQMSLTNPQTFIAFLGILEDYSTMSMWLSDNETAGVIGHILRTYHEEKHILAINQFSTDDS